MAPPDPTPVMPRPRFFFAASLTAGLFFVAWSWFVGANTVPAFDRSCAAQCSIWCNDRPNSWQLAVLLTDLGGIAAMILLAGMGILWQRSLNHRALALAWLGVIFGGGVLNLAFKDAFDRPRPSPDLRDRAVLETNCSYPSGHSMGSAIGYGMLGYALVRTQPRRRRRFVTVFLLTSLVLAIGLSRIYLRAHWFSDVIAGWAIGVAWLCFCLGWIERRRRAPLAA